MSPASPAHPQVAKLDATLRARHRFASGLVSRALDEFGAPWADEFDALLAALFPEDGALEAAVAGYATFAMQSMRLQAAFEREGRYKPKTHAEASAEVYDNERHMLDAYLPGLLLSHYLWPHHYRQLQFFEAAFVARMRVAAAAGQPVDFVEVGVGTGLYSATLLAALPARGLGLDLSPWSKAFCLRQLAARGLADRYDVELRDIIARPLERPPAWLVCVEVLEHLDEPVAFLRALRASMAPGGRAFVTAAVNAAHADHIYLYRSGADVLAHLREAGFWPEQAFAATAYRPTLPGAPVPEAVAFVVTA